MFDSSVYRERREALRRSLAERGRDSGTVLFLGNRESPMNYPDNPYPFRQDSSFLYFAGIPRPDLALTLDLGTGKALLYGDEISLDDVIWTGPRPSLRELADEAGLDGIRPRASLAGAAGSAKPLRFLPPYRAEHREELAELLGTSPKAVEAEASVDLIRAVVALREVKEPREVERMDAAADLTADMHRAVLARARPGVREVELAARAEEVARAGGAGLAFPVIATTRGSVLHNHDHSGVLADGDLFLMDMGAETADGYAGDLTTTFPVNGRFDPRQRELYEILLSAFRAATASLAPGVPYRDVHFAAAREIFTGMKALGLARGNTEEALAAGAHALFFPHGVGHQIGLDVHDMESLGEVNVGYDGLPKSPQFGLRSLRLAKPLRPGMAVTVEPGIYFIAPLIAKWKAEGLHRGFLEYSKIEEWVSVGGMRNEEDWLVTETGARKLGGPFDKSAPALEAAAGSEWRDRR
ncbi:MAG: aminopeptidase P family protein [Treponema sp.]|nr:aminopeptidase P family protein [Treponema sp.]